VQETIWWFVNVSNLKKAILADKRMILITFMNITEASVYYEC